LTTRYITKNKLGKSGNIIKSKLRWLRNITKIYLADQGISPNISLCNQGISSEINTLILPSNSLKQISQKCSRFSLIAYLVEVLLNRQSTVLWVQTALFCTRLVLLFVFGGGCLIRSRNCIHFASTWVHPLFFGGVRVAYLFSFFMLSYYVSLRSEFHVVKSYSSYRKECTQVWV
jgi:hypothetical protein